MKITTDDLIKAVVASDGNEYPFKDVEAILNQGLFDRLNQCLINFNRSCSIKYLDWEVRMIYFAGRTLITFIAPDQDWISFCGATDKKDCLCSIHGVYYIDPPLNKFFVFSQQLLQAPNFECMTVDEPTFVVI